MEDVTVDSVFQGKLEVKQHKRGYRFSIDSLLLAHFAGPLAAEKVLDLGTGCGVVSLILAVRYERAILYGVEIQEDLARIAAENAIDNGLSDRVDIHCMDMRQVTEDLTCGPVDLVVGNPPFHPVSSGRLNPDHQRARARHELNITLPEVVDTAARMLRAGGRFVAIYPARRLDGMLLELRRREIYPRTLQLVHPKADGPAKLFLVEGVKGKQGTMASLPPFVIYQASGGYTDEAKGMFLLSSGQGERIPGDHGDGAILMASASALPSV